jgi:hypothetical protein
MYNSAKVHLSRNIYQDVTLSQSRKQHHGSSSSLFVFSTTNFKN